MRPVLLSRFAAVTSLIVIGLSAVRCGSSSGVSDVASFDAGEGARDAVISGRADQGSDVEVGDASAGDSSGPDAGALGADATPSDASGGFDAGIAPDAGPTRTCRIVAGPSILPDCNGCRGVIAAAPSGWILGQTGAAQSLTLDGAPLGASFSLIDPTASHSFYELALSSSAFGLWALATQGHSQSSEADVLLGRFDPSGTRTSSRAVGLPFSVAGAIAMSSAGLGLAWIQGYASGSEGVALEATDPDGHALGSFFRRTGVPLNPLQMSMIASANAYLACAGESSGLGWYRLGFDGSGGSYVSLPFASGGDIPRCNVLDAAGGTVAIWGSDTGSYFVRFTALAPPAITASALSFNPAALPGASGGEMLSTFAAARGAEVGLAFRYANGSRFDVAFTLVDANGSAVSDPIHVASVAAFRSRPSVGVADDGSFAMVWPDTGGLHFARIGCGP